MTIRMAVSAIVLSLSASAMAAEMAKDTPFTSPAEKEFAALDQDGNGKLSKEEASVNPEIIKMLAKIDTDNNGEIEVSEYLIHKSEATAAGEKKVTEEETK